MALCQICLAGALVGCLFTLAECVFVIRFSGEPIGRSAPQPPVTMLKPLHGAEPGLSARLAQFCEQDYNGPVQLIFGAQNDGAPDAAIAREIKAAFPDEAIEIAVDARSHGRNRKVANLINMLSHARCDTVVVSDSDIVVGPDYLRGVTALLAPPNVGVVTCLYHGIGDDGLWPRLSALAINTHFLPQAITAASLGLADHCCGATIALRRSLLDRIGGFGAYADILADDYAIGLAVRSAGYDIVTAPFLVGHRCFEASLRQHVLHQLRVARTIRSIEPIGYAGTIITHSWPLALMGLPSGGGIAILVAAAAVASRVMLCQCVERRFGLPRQNYWLVPLQDVIAFGVYVASFFGATVHWRGSDYRVAEDGTLIERNT
jgi:ceramide glucosyltransferase